MTHQDLVELAARWLRGTRRCTVVLTEAQGGHEVPDAIGWASMGRASILVECKATRSDFLRDGRKLSRLHGDLFRVGQRRIYITAAGVIHPGECPAGWGHGEAVPGRAGGGYIVRMRTPMPAHTRIDPEIMAREVPYLVAALAVVQAEPSTFCGLSGGRVIGDMRMPDGSRRRSCAACIRAKRPCPGGAPEPIECGQSECDDMAEPGRQFCKPHGWRERPPRVLVACAGCGRDSCTRPEPECVASHTSAP